MFAQTTHVVAAPHGFACVAIPETRLYIPSFIEIRWRVSEPQGVKIWPFSLLWLVAFTTACTTVQAVISLQDLMCVQFCVWSEDREMMTIIFIYGCRRKMRRDLWPSSLLLCRVRLPVPLVFLKTTKNVQQVVKELWRNAASYVLQFLRIELFLLLRTPQERLPMLFSGPNNLNKSPPPVVRFRPHLIHGSLGKHGSTPKRHLDRISRFAGLNRLPNRQTVRPRYVWHLSQCGLKITATTKFWKPVGSIEVYRITLTDCLCFQIRLQHLHFIHN